jgi:hypothetical protein
MRSTTLATFVTVIVLAAGLSAQHEPAQHDKKADAPTVTGAWNISLQGDHVIPVGMELTQERDKVTGKILMPTQQVGERRDVSLSGQFVDGVLTLSGTAEGASDESAKVELTAKMEDDGTLSGKLSSHHGSMPWTAERLKQRKP